MTYIADESVDRGIVHALREAGHEVEYVADLWPGISDPEVLERARASGSVLLSGDKEFGELVFRRGAGCEGVVLFRLPGLAQHDKAGVAVEAFRRYGPSSSTHSPLLNAEGCESESISVATASLQGLGLPSGA